MPRKGWSAMQVPEGWLQVIRGPRPPAQKWPRARQPAPRVGQKVHQHVQRSQQVPHVPMDPDAFIANARSRASKLEAAMQAVGESDPAYPGLLEALKKTRVQAQVKPVQDRIAATESYLERARKRVLSSRQEVERAKETVATAERKLALEEDGVLQAEGRLSALRQEANGTTEGPPPTLPADFALELTRLRSFVQELQRERDDLRAQVAAQTVVTEDRPRKTNRSISTPSPDLVLSSPSQLALLPGAGGRDLSTVMETLIDQAESAVRVAQQPVPMRTT